MTSLSINIHVENEIVSAGKQLQGKVVFDAKEEISAKEVLVTLNGEEITQVEWHETKEINGVRTRISKRDNGYRSFLSVQIPVESFPVIQNQKILPGQYDVPFAVELPDHIPSSLLVSEDVNDSDCRIQYEIKVQLRGSGNLSDYKQTKPVQVQGKSLPREAMPFVSQPVESQVNSCCCFNQGNIVFGAKVLDTRLDKGETCNIHLSIRNNSTVDIQEVGARLYQVVQWEGKQLHPCSRGRTLGNFHFPSLPGTARQQVGEREIELDQLKRVFEEIEQGRYSTQIVMPADAFASYKGSFIKITHHLNIYVKAGSCVSSPEIQVPILCGEAPPAAEGDETNPPSPHYWNNSNNMPYLCPVPTLISAVCRPSQMIRI